jgi:hypothetical protein
MADNQALGVAWIYHRIHAYCEARANGIGGHYAQHSYKKEFFDIFADAMIAGWAGPSARNALRRKNARLKRKRVSQDSYVVSGHSVREYLEHNWLLRKNRISDNKEMVATLAHWWDLWEFGASHFPPTSGISRRRKRVKELFLRWLGGRQ